MFLIKKYRGPQTQTIGGSNLENIYGECYFSKLYCMSNLHIDCPHCGASFDVELQGETANMMVFCCAKCKTPLMYCHGEVGELDREEFANLRKKLTRAIDAAVSRDGSLAGVAEALRQMVETSNALAEERSEEQVDDHCEQSESQDRTAKPCLNDDTLAALQKDLDEMDAESFLDQL